MDACIRQHFTPVTAEFLVKNKLGIYVGMAIGAPLNVLWHAYIITLIV